MVLKELNCRFLCAGGKEFFCKPVLCESKVKFPAGNLPLIEVVLLSTITLVLLISTKVKRKTMKIENKKRN